jgi:steroid 5-alpha reductase family enzyme
MWTADLSGSIASETAGFPFSRMPGIPASQMNVGLWDVSSQPGVLIVRLLWKAYYQIDVKTGEITALPHS